VSILLGRFGLPRLPTGALAHVKYPIVVDARAFREQTGFAAPHDEIEAMQAFRDAFPPPR
jgi:UDP-glucose 4-epimerase